MNRKWTLLAGLLLFAGRAMAAADSGLAGRAAELGRLFDGRTQGARHGGLPLLKAEGLEPFAAEDAAPGVRAQELQRVLAGIYVPVLAEGVEKTLEARSAELERKYGFARDWSFKPVVQNDSRERPPVWQGSMVYLVRGWIGRERLAELREDPFVKGVWPDIRVEPAGPPQANVPMGPPRRKDLFKDIEACHAADAVFATQPTLPGAVNMLGPCLEEVSRIYGATVRAEFNRRLPVNALAEAVINIVVRGELAHYRVVEDLEAALDLRRGALLTYRAAVVNKATLRTSSLQSVVDGCVLPMLVSSIKDADGFVRVYESCLERAPGLRIGAVFAAKDRSGRLVLVISDADRTAVAAMNGKVVVPGEGGRVELQIRASKALRYQLREPRSSR